MEFVLLGLLGIQPMTIYDMNQSFKSGISLFYSASYGSIQNAVKKLIKKGFITFEERIDNGRNKKIYSITPGGQVAYREWMLAPPDLQKLETVALTKLHFLGTRTREDRIHILQGLIDAIEQVEDQLGGLHQQVSAIEVDPSYMDIYRYQVKTLEYGLMSHGAGKAWFEKLLAAEKDS